MTTPQHKNPCPGGHEIYNFGRPIIGHHYYLLSLIELFPGVEKKTFKEIHKFYTFYPRITVPPLRVGVMKFAISCLLTLQMLHTKFD